MRLVVEQRQLTLQAAAAAAAALLLLLLQVCQGGNAEGSAVSGVSSTRQPRQGTPPQQHHQVCTAGNIMHGPHTVCNLWSCVCTSPTKI
jgi:hypothetical protein